jgi:hypothetical protein
MSQLPEQILNPTGTQFTSPLAQGMNMLNAMPIPNQPIPIDTGAQPIQESK